jgi:isopenicillin N synthase-like dioxygenase
MSADAPGFHVIAGDALREPTADCIATVADGARRHGMFYLTGHGATRDVAATMEITRAFFDLPLQERMALAARGPQDFGYRGADPTAQHLALTRTPEPHPLFGRVTWPARPPSFQPVVEAYLDRMRAIAMHVLSAVARSLDLPSDHFEALFGARAIDNLQLRLYDAQAVHKPLPLAAHSDPPPITLIAQDDVGGLDSLCGPEWVPVPPKPDALVCQFGLMMARWTDERYPANVHRVRSEPGTLRHSIVYNLLPPPDVMIERLPSCRSDPGSRHAGSISLDDFLTKHLPRPYEASTSTGEGSRDENLAARLGDAVRRAMGDRWQLEDATREGEGIRLRLRAGDQTIELDVARVEAGKRYYRALGGTGFSYRNRAMTPTLLADLGRVIDALAPVMKASLGS